MLAITACKQQAQNDRNSELDIASQDWIMTTIQSQNAEDNGLIVAYGSNGNSSEKIAKIDMVFSAENGQCILFNKTNNKTYSGEYTVKSKSATSTIYDISIGYAKGIAVVSYTKCNDDSQVGTLIISFEDYALSFSSKSN